MGDVVVTAAKVALVEPEKADVFTGIAGVTITAGQAVYGIISSGKLGLADEDADAEHSAVLGIALNGGGAGAEAAAGEKSHFDARVIPSVAYTDPEIAWVGITEDEAKAKGVKVSTPVMKPTVSFTFGHGRKLPCEQSCMMMKVRIRSPPSGMISRAAAHGAVPMSQ